MLHQQQLRDSIKLDVVEFTLLIHPLDELTNLIDGQSHTLLSGNSTIL